MHDNKKYWRGVGIGYIVLILIIVLTYASCGCNVQKKAEARVLANYESVKTIRAKTENLFPCSNDTTVNVISDTVTRFDTAYLQNDLQKDYSNGPATPMYGDPFFPKSFQ